MNVMKIVKIGLMASISSNLIHSDWCELCFSDYKEINPPESNLAEEAQKIKESNNKARNNCDKNIKKININGTEDDKSKTNPFGAREAENYDNKNTSECEIISEDIEMNNRMNNRMNPNNSNIIPDFNNIETTKNNSLDKRSYNAETSGRKDDKPETEIEGPDPNDFNYNSSQNPNDCNYNPSLDRNDCNYNSSLDRNDCNPSSKDINTNIREDLSNNNASNTDKNHVINNEDEEVAANNNEEVDENNSGNKEVAANNNEGIAENNSNEEIAATNPGVDEDCCPKTRDERECFDGQNIYE